MVMSGEDFGAGGVALAGSHQVIQVESEISFAEPAICDFIIFDEPIHSPRTALQYLCRLPQRKKTAKNWGSLHVRRGASELSQRFHVKMT